MIPATTFFLPVSHAAIKGFTVNTARILLVTVFLMLILTLTNATAQNGPPDVPGEPSEGFGQAFDEAANYDSANPWEDGSNAGFGFGPWEIITGGSAGAFIGDPGEAEIDGLGTTAFGLFANPIGDNFVNVGRSLSTPLPIGGTFSFLWGTNFTTGTGGGDKGFNLIVGGEELINVNQSSSDTITITANSSSQNLFTAYGTDAMEFSFIRISETELEVIVTPRGSGDNFEATFDIGDSAIDFFQFYASDFENNDVRRQPYFDQLEVSFPFADPPSQSALNLIFSNITDTSMRLSWTNGDGDGRIVVAREGSPVTFIPANGNEYPADSDFTQASDLDDGNKVVYEEVSNNPGDTFTVTGLSPNTTYYFRVYEFNRNLDGNDDEIVAERSYRTFSPLEGSETTLDDSNLFLSAATGPWNAASTWVNNQVPTQDANVVILDDHVVTLNVDSERLSSIRVNSGGELTNENENILNITCGGDFIVEGTGTFTGGTGTVDFSGTDSGESISAVIGVVEFGNVSIGAAPGTCGVNFGGNSDLGGVLEIISGGFVETNPPAYQIGSELFYNTEGPYERSAEWPSVADENDPYNVRINSNLDMDGHTSARQVRGDLQIDEDASLTLSDQFNGDLRVGGNWNNEGSFNSNDRAVFFDGNGVQEIRNEQAGGIQIDFIVNNNTSETEGLIFFDDVTLNSYESSGLARFDDSNGPYTFTVNRFSDISRPVIISAGISDFSNADFVYEDSGTDSFSFFFDVEEDAGLTFRGIDIPGEKNLVKEGDGLLTLVGSSNTDLFVDAGIVALTGDFMFDDPEESTIDLGTAVESDGRHTQSAEVIIRDISLEADAVNVKSFDSESGPRFLRFESEDEENQATLTTTLDLEKLLFLMVEDENYGVLAGEVAGSSPFVKQENGTLTLETETFEPNIFIDEGQVRLNSPFSTGYEGIIALGTDVENERVESDAALIIGELDASDPFAISPNIQIRGDQGSFEAGDRTIVFDSGEQIATINSKIALAATLNVTVADGAFGVINDDISGSNGLNKRGSGQLDLAADNSFTGTVQLFDGTLRLGGNGLPGTNPVQIRGSVRLASINTVARTISNPVEFFNEGLSLGQESGGTGSLTFTGNFELGAAERFLNTTGNHSITGNIVNGSLRKEGSGRLDLSGENEVSETVVNEGILRLNRTSGNTITLGGQITVNDGGSLNYTESGGANNQLNNTTSVVINEGGEFDIGARTDTIENLQISGGTLNTGSGQFTVTNNSEISGTININSVNAVLAFEQDLIITDDIDVNFSSSGISNNNNELISLGGDLIVNEGTAVFNENSISGAAIPQFNLNNSERTITIEEGAELISFWGFRSPNAADGAIRKTGPGILILNEESTFAGGTEIEEGTVAISQSNSLGPASGNVTLSGGTLRADADITLGNTITLSENTVSSIEVSEGGDPVNPFILSVTNSMGGDGNLTKTGPGTLTLEDDATYSGETDVQAGIMNVNAGFVSTNLSIGENSQLNFLAPGSSRVLELSGLSIGSGATLTIGGDNDVFTIPNTFPVTIPENATVETSGTDARLTLQSGARYVNLSSSTPNLQVERVFEDGQGWRMLASPVVATYSDMFAPPFVTQGFAGATFPGRQFNLLWWDETDATGTTLQRWRTLSQTTNETGDNIPAGRGHFFYIFDGAPMPDDNGATGDYSDNLPLTMSTTGTEPDLSEDPFSFDISFTEVDEEVIENDTFIGALVQDQGWNLIGNPTASWLDWTLDTNSEWTKNQVSETMYVWDPGLNNGDGDYRFTNGLTGNHNGRIAPYQAFWVQATDENPELKFTNAAKVTEAGTFYGRPAIAGRVAESDALENSEKSPENASSTTVLPMKLHFSYQGHARKTEKFLMFSDRGRFGADRWDAFRLQPMSESWLVLASAMHLGSAPLSINSLPAFEELSGPLNIPLYAGGSKKGEPLSGEFTLEWEMPESWDPEIALVLMDHHTQQAIPMRSRKSYTFSHQTDSAMLPAMVSPKGESVSNPAQFSAGNDSRPENRRSGAYAVHQSVRSQGKGSVVSLKIPQNLLSARPLRAEWQPDYEAVQQLIPAENVNKGDEPGYHYVPLVSETGGSENDSQTHLGKGTGGSGSSGSVRFSLFMQPVSEGSGGDDSIPYMPLEATLFQNYPNPFNPTTTIRFSLPEAEQVRVEIFDLLGRRVELLADAPFEPGTHTFQWNANGRASGVYIIRLTTESKALTRKMTLLR